MFASIHAFANNMIEVAKQPAPSSRSKRHRVCATCLNRGSLCHEPSDFFAEHGLGAENAPGRTQGDTIDKNPGKAPVASDSGSTNVGIEPGTNQPGEKGITGVPVSSEPAQGGANMKS